MKKQIIFSLVLLLFGVCLLSMGIFLKRYNDKKDEELISMAFTYATALKKTKSEEDLVKVKEILKDVKDEKEKENIEDIVNQAVLTISKEKVRDSYNLILNEIEVSLDEDKLLSVKNEIETISYDDVKGVLLERISEIENKINEKKKEIEKEKYYNYLKNKDSEMVISNKVDATVLETLYGKVTAFTPYCFDGCNGYVASGMYVGDGNIYYNDKEYGKVRIVAADKSYPFGTIVKIKNLWYFNEDVYAIVLDRGGAIGKNKRALFDLLFALEENANTFGVENATCEILRLGY